MKILLGGTRTYLREKIEKYKKLALISLPISLIFLLINVYLGLFSLCITMWLYFGKTKWQRGIEGEEMVESVLSALDDSYLLINDVRLYPKWGNIDHILLGPTGIFVIETKHYRTKIIYDGHKWYSTHPTKRRYPKHQIKDPVVQVRRNATSLKNFLKRCAGRDVEVIPILVFSHPNVKLAIKSSPSCQIMKINELTGFIRKQSSKIYKKNELQAICDTILKNTFR
jgi:hypothetical protein